MFGLFKNPARDGARLARDAKTIIEIERESSAMDRLNRIAAALNDELSHAKERLAARPDNRKVILYDLQQLNAAARRHDQIRFTALTLVVIAMRADSLGEHGREAIDIVHAFAQNPGVDSNTVSA